MEENALVATLKDTVVAIENRITKIKEALKKFDSHSESEKRDLVIKIQLDFKTLSQNISQMTNDINQLHDENNEKTYTDQHVIFKQEKKKLEDEFDIKRIKMKDDGLINENGVKGNKKDISEMTSQEVMNKGDKRLKKDRDLLINMEMITLKDVTKSKAINETIGHQLTQLDNTGAVIKDMNASLERANKNLGQMLKMYATDKMIMIMIIIIVLIIVGIIIAAAVGGDPNKMFNAPHDIFNVKSQNSTNSTL